MNQIQAAIARVTGIDQVIDSQQTTLGEITEVMEQLAVDNQMLNRQLEDIDYLNLFELNMITDVLPLADRKKTIAKLRRLRHDNPLAKQAVKLVIRFTLGKGIQWILASEKVDVAAQAPPAQLPIEQQSTKGTFPIKFAPAAGGNGTGGQPNPPAGKTVPSQNSVEAGSIDVSTDADPIRDILTAFWEDPDNELAFTSHRAMQAMLDEVLTDGEKFYACFEAPAAPYLKVTEIPVEEIVHIIYDPNNHLRPVYYRRQFQKMIFDGQSDMYKPDGSPQTEYYLDYRITDDMMTGDKDHPGLKQTIKIPAEKIRTGVKMRHVMINELWTRSGKRGISELYASREWFRVFREFMEGRAAINQAAQAISYLRKVKGGPAAVANFHGKFGGLNVGATENDGVNEVQKLTRPSAAAIYDSNEAVDLSWMRTDTGAQNAKEDAHMLLATGGAGVGTMVHYFGEGGDANLATAQAMELPMVKTYEDWQKFVENFFLDWFKYLLTIANDDPESINDDVTRIGFTFPPIISRDVVKYTTAWAQVTRDIAPNNMAVKKQAMRAVLSILDVPNIDGLMPEIEAEMDAVEAQRKAQAQAMLENLANAPQPPVLPASGNGTGGPPFKKKPVIPGLDPNTRHLVAGKGEKVSNGPKQA